MIAFDFNFPKIEDFLRPAKNRNFVPPWNINSMLATSEITSDFSGSNPAEEAPVNRPNRDRCNLDLRIFDIISVPV